MGFTLKEQLSTKRQLEGGAGVSGCGSKLTEAWGQQVIVDSRVGANGTIGAGIAARAAPDGYTLLMVTLQIVLVAAMNEKFSFDLIRAAGLRPE